MSYKSSSCILGTGLLSDIQFANIFSHPVGCLFKFLMVLLAAQKFLILMKSNLFIFPFIACAFGVVSKNAWPNARSQRFSPQGFIVLALTFHSPFRSVIHFKLILVYGVRKGPTFILLHVVIQLSQHCLSHILLNSPFPSSSSSQSPQDPQFYMPSCLPVAC